jgi:GAF domain-containing protein
MLTRNPAEMRQAGLVSSHVEALLERGVHTFMLVPLTAHGVTLGVAVFNRAEHPVPYDQADVLLVSDLAARAAVHIDNARLYTREHEGAVTLQRSPPGSLARPDHAPAQRRAGRARRGGRRHLPARGV